MLRRLISEDIVLETHLEHDIGPVVADPNQLEQVILNLVVNARDAMPQGGRITIETDRVTAPTGSTQPAETRPHVVLRVRDNGSGIPPAVRERMFEPFFTTKEVGKGTGLGLSTVYGIVAQTGGYIEVESEPGGGSVFTVFLPAVDEELSLPASPPASAASAGAGVPLGGNETVLLVEDEESVRRLAARILRKHGYTVVESAGPDEALAHLETMDRKPDLLITDLVMSGMNGRELARKILLRCRNIRVLLMSGYSAEEVAFGNVRSDSFALLEKPFTPSAFVQAVRDVLGR